MSRQNRGKEIILNLSNFCLSNHYLNWKLSPKCHISTQEITLSGNNRKRVPALIFIKMAKQLHIVECKHYFGSKTSPWPGLSVGRLAGLSVIISYLILGKCCHLFYTIWQILCFLYSKGQYCYFIFIIFRELL